MNFRPDVSKRTFISDEVEKTIDNVKLKVSDKEIVMLFENCFPNTLDTTIRYTEKDGYEDTYVITGDIKAMWLRDSTAQVFPYLKLAAKDAKLKKMIKGIINRQFRYIGIDPYANAFNDGPTNEGWRKDNTEMLPEVYERKWEIDSLCYPVRLSFNYWKITSDSSIFDDKWKESATKIYSTFLEQQRKTGRGKYNFTRNTSWQTDTVAGNGWGNPIRPIGLIVSIFRPSDDATIFPFLIPANFFAVQSLKQMAEILEIIYKEKNYADKFLSLAKEVEDAIYKYALFNHPKWGNIFAYEADGFGNMHFMDDANVPSLLSLRYLDCCSPDDELYRNTRNFVLSNDNPYFFKGKYGEGVGSPHTLLDKIWPISLIMRALTSYDDDEIKNSLNILKNTHNSTYFMHESFHKENPADFSRKWFAWANTLFGELILKILEERPHILT